MYAHLDSFIRRKDQSFCPPWEMKNSGCESKLMSPFLSGWKGIHYVQYTSTYIYSSPSLSLYMYTYTHIYIYTYISGGAVACLSYNLCSRTYVLPVVLCGHGHDHVYWFAVQRLGCGQIMSHSCQGRVSHNHREHSELLDVHIPVLVGGWWPLEFTEKLYPNGVPVKHCLLAVASGLPWSKLQHLTCCTLAFSQDFCAGTAIVPLLILDDPSLSPIDPTICIYMYPIEHGSWDVASEKLSGDG